jgi:hypothetical protein
MNISLRFPSTRPPFISAWRSTASSSTLYAADNAGEIVFDRVIARHLGVEEGGIILMKGEKNAQLLQ